MMESETCVSLNPTARATSDGAPLTLFGSSGFSAEDITTTGLKKEDNTMTVKPEELKSLLELFSKTTYKARDTQPKIQDVIQRCLSLFDLDYKYSVLPNANGDLSSNYPSSLVILESEKESSETRNSLVSSPKSTNGNSNGECSYTNHANLKTIGTGLNPSWKVSTNISSLGLNGIQDNNLELPKLKDLCVKAKVARCRQRFPIPVILYNNKHICRSATLSGGPEIYGRSINDYLFSGGGTDAEPEKSEEDTKEVVPEAPPGDWQLFDRVRSQDIRLLKAFQVQTIVDLMVEKKKVKFGVNVTSSEKVDKENRYVEFNIVSLPYPGCEFFKQYRDNGYRAEELVFEWNQGHVDANICVPSDAASASLKLDWSHYRDWDLVLLTQNYLKLLLAYLRERESGLLIHCISGWDRTPLFVSLLRLSLWADGQIHKSLDADQMLYLTLAYDWLLFGHNLEDRLSKGEEILFFCFNFLKYIVDPEFRVDHIPEPPKSQLFSRVRNDSDIHLEGVLLDGDVSHTSPEGSNWSLNSCSSSQSNKSKDNPPAYFPVSQDSWEDCNGAQHLMSQYHSNGSFAQPISNPRLTTNGSLATSCMITASMMNSTSTLPSSSLTSSNGDHGLNGELSKSTTSPSCSQTNFLQCPTSPLATTSSSSRKENGTSNGTNGGHHGRTSPVAVPTSNRLTSHSHQVRPESNSSASIGSWQFVNGVGSLRDTISTSDPGSGSSHSNPTRLLIRNPVVDCIEASESSSTLVGELSPTGSKPLLMSSTFKSDGVNGIAVSTLSQALRDELDLALAYDETDSGPVETSPCVQTPDTLTFSLPREEDASICTATTTPTKEHENDEDQVDGRSPGFLNNNNTIVSLLNAARRRERLEKVRNRFYNLYEDIIGLPTFRTAENNGSSGFGFLIGNLATKVGIRSAAPLHRTSHV